MTVTITPRTNHELQHCCGKEFSSKAEFQEHFASAHDPASPSYVEPENQNAPAPEVAPAEETQEGA